MTVNNLIGAVIPTQVLLGEQQLLLTTGLSLSHQDFTIFKKMKYDIYVYIHIYTFKTFKNFSVQF